MFNINDIMGKMQEMQQRLQDAKSRLDTVIAEAESGGGMVRVKANANHKILAVTIDPDMVDKNDMEILQDLITAAVNKAIEKAEMMGKEEMQKVSKDILPDIPGLDLGKIGFK